MNFIIRYPIQSDWKQLWLFINELSQEKTYTSFQGEHISQQYEKQYIRTSIKNIKQHKSVQLIVDDDGKIVGSAQIECKPRNQNHVGIVGISILSSHRNQGIGRKLFQKLLLESKKNLPQLRLVELSVMANNLRAIHLYQSLGFMEVGRIRNGIRHDGKFIDNIIMTKEIND